MPYDELLRYTEQIKGTIAQLSKPRVVVTAPHAACLSAKDASEHTCDVVCGQMAAEISQGLSRGEYLPVTLIADVNRMEMDMNRPEARGSEFRNKVDLALNDAVFLLDVHSFPQLDVPWEVDLYLLKLKYGGNNDEIVYDLSKHLIAAGLNVAVVSAEKPNDIVLSAVERDVPAALVEFSEPRVEQGLDITKKFMSGFRSFLKEKVGG